MRVRALSLLFLLAVASSCQKKELNNLRNQNDALSAKVRSLEESKKASDAAADRAVSFQWEILEKLTALSAAEAEFLKLRREKEFGLVEETGPEDQLRASVSGLERRLEEIRKLKDQLGTMSTKLQGLEKKVLELQEIILEKEHLIEGYRAEVDAGRKRVENCEQQLLGIESIAREYKQKTDDLTQEVTGLRGGFVVIASSKALNAMRKEGLIAEGKDETFLLAAGIKSIGVTRAGIVVVRAIDNLEIDVPLAASKAKMVSIHRYFTLTYSLQSQGGRVRLKVLDPQAFWAVSRYPVIETE